jgi:hypothetical protein
VTSVRYRRKSSDSGKAWVANLSIAAFAASLLTAPALAVDRGTPFRPKPIESYEARITFDQVTIAADPFDTAEKTATAFGKLNLPEYGILPVLIVIENKRSAPIDLKSLLATYRARGGDEIEATPASDIRFAGGGPRKPKLPGSAPIPLPFPTRGKKNPLADSIVEERGFAAKVIAPGESAHGFVYFQTGYKGSVTLTLSGLRDAATAKDLFFFEIPITHR